jgi:hypothetical protein
MPQHESKETSTLFKRAIHKVGRRVAIESELLKY